MVEVICFLQISTSACDKGTLTYRQTLQSIEYNVADLKKKKTGENVFTKKALTLPD